jgi:Fe2+ or Zn2+ uptake regulation protein
MTAGTWLAISDGIKSCFAKSKSRIYSAIQQVNNNVACDCVYPRILSTAKHLGLVGRAGVENSVLALIHAHGRHADVFICVVHFTRVTFLPEVATLQAIPAYTQCLASCFVVCS